MKGQCAERTRESEGTSDVRISMGGLRTEEIENWGTGQGD